MYMAFLSAGASAGNWLVWDWTMMEDLMTEDLFIGLSCHGNQGYLLRNPFKTP